MSVSSTDQELRRIAAAKLAEPIVRHGAVACLMVGLAPGGRVIVSPSPATSKETILKVMREAYRQLEKGE